MRTFIALEFPNSVHQQLATVCDALRSELHAHRAPPALRWLPSVNIHLTLRFLGETTQAQRQMLAIGLREATASRPPFDLTIGNLGGFPHLRQPRVVWLGVGGELPQLHRLQAAVEETVQLAGFVAEERPFSAHITLARAQRTLPQTQLRAVGKLLQEYASVPRMQFQVKEVVHIQSDLRTGGAVYRPIGRFPLALDPT